MLADRGRGRGAGETEREKRRERERGRPRETERGKPDLRTRQNTVITYVTPSGFVVVGKSRSRPLGLG